MSWSIKAQGTKQDLTRSVFQDPQAQHIPAEAREAIRHLISSVGSTPRMSFETYGHVDSTGVGNLSVTIKPLPANDTAAPTTQSS